MKHLQTIALLVVAFLAVWTEATFGWPRRWLGTQIDLLPVLVIYAALFAGVPALALVSVLGGMWFDSLSENPLGVSVLPLFAVGLVASHFRELILREQSHAQLLLGLAAGALVPLGTLLIIMAVGVTPLIGIALAMVGDDRRLRIAHPRFCAAVQLARPHLWLSRNGAAPFPQRPRDRQEPPLICSSLISSRKATHACA
jgi:cell shape-determining protein MreD